jgi:hypothetical protein
MKANFVQDVVDLPGRLLLGASSVAIFFDTCEMRGLKCKGGKLPSC